MVLRECGIASALATAAFVFVLVAGNVLQQVLGAVATGRVDVGQALQLVGLLFPAVLPYGLPMGVLTGVLLGFGRMAAEGEVTAMKAAGVSLWRMALPLWLSLLALLPGCLWLNLMAGPASEARFQEIVMGATLRNPAVAIQPGRLNRQFKGFLILAQGKVGDVLQDVWLWKVDPMGKVLQALHAAEAHVAATYDAQGAPILRVGLVEPRVVGQEDGRSPEFSSAAGSVLELPREEPGMASSVRRLRMMTAVDLMRAVDEGWQVSAGAPAAARAQERTVLWTQVMFRVATALSVLSLAFLAVPLAVRVGRSEVNVNATLALGVSLGYYFLTSAASWVKAPQWHPEVLVLLPNVLLFGVGFWLMRRGAGR